MTHRVVQWGRGNVSRGALRRAALLLALFPFLANPSCNSEEPEAAKSPALPAPPIDSAEPGARPSSGELAAMQRQIAEREYWASHNDLGLQAPNRIHNLRTYFEPTGIRVVDRTAAGSPELLALRLAGVGRGEKLIPTGPGEVTSDGARVEIRRPGLIEWYVNSRAGLTQGFTLKERPEGEGPLVLALSVARGEAVLHGDAVVFRTAAGRRLRYGRLEAVDAAGRSLAARVEVPSPDRLRLLVEEGRAPYPLTLSSRATTTTVSSGRASDRISVARLPLSWRRLREGR